MSGVKKNFEVHAKNKMLRMILVRAQKERRAGSQPGS